MQHIQSIKDRYFHRKGYQPENGKAIFAKHEVTKKAVAYHDGTFNRQAFRTIHAEAAALGLTRLTVLVNGLVTYSGGNLTTIRVDQPIEPMFLDEDLTKDFMSDVTAARRQKRSVS